MTGPSLLYCFRRIISNSWVWSKSQVEMDVPSLLGLPTEILEQIVTHPCLSLQDVCRISLTCGRLHRLISNSWSLIANARYNLLLNGKNIFSFSRWSWWEGCTGKSNEEWYTLCRQRHMCESKLDSLLQVTIKKGVSIMLNINSLWICTR